MRNFRFRLEKALDWRRKQFELEETAYRRELAALSDLDRARAALATEAGEVENGIREAPHVSGEDLTALRGYRLGLAARKENLKTMREQASRKVEDRQRSMIAAKRRCLLLEKLKEKRLEGWKQAENRELDELAADSYLARYCRNRARPGTTI